MAKQQTQARTVPQQAKPTPGAQKTGETVTIACKLPHGIVIHREVKRMRPVAVLGGGTRDEAYFERVHGSEITIFGNARAVGKSFRTRVVGGFALTQGVPKDLWEAWLESHRDMPAVRNGLIKALPNVGQAAEYSRENAKIKSGLEPLNPDGDERRPRSLRSEIGEITENDQAKHDFETVDEEA